MSETLNTAWKNHPKTEVATGLLIATIITLIILAIAGVFNPPKQNRLRQPLPLYSDKKMGLWETTAKCRLKYPNHPLAFGNEVINKKGCYTCPKGYLLRHDELLDEKLYEDKDIRCVKGEYKPAKGKKIDDNDYRLSCLDYYDDGYSLYDDKSSPEKRTTPWDTIQPSACGVAKNQQTDFKSAVFLGST